MFWPGRYRGVSAVDAARRAGYEPIGYQAPSLAELDALRRRIRRRRRRASRRGEAAARRAENEKMVTLAAYVALAERGVLSDVELAVIVAAENLV